MAVNIEEVLEAAKKVFEARGFRVTQVGEAVAAEEVAARERAEADSANASEDDAIGVLKTLATEYQKEQ